MLDLVEVHFWTMSDRDEHDEDGAPMELFWLGNFDEGNKVEADYLDEASLNFGLINFTKKILCSE